jgi:hypothetical protein
MKAPVLSHVILYEIRGEQSGTGVRFSLSFFSFTLLIIIPPLLHTHLSLLLEVFDSPDQAAHYHILGL